MTGPFHRPPRAVVSRRRAGFGEATSSRRLAKGEASAGGWTGFATGGDAAAGSTGAWRRAEAPGGTADGCLACRTTPQLVQRIGWWIQSAGMRRTALHPGHFARMTAAMNVFSPVPTRGMA
jgi:hypothetical protein